MEFWLPRKARSPWRLGLVWRPGERGGRQPCADRYRTCHGTTSDAAITNSLFQPSLGTAWSLSWTAYAQMTKARPENGSPETEWLPAARWSVILAFNPPCRRGGLLPYTSDLMISSLAREPAVKFRKALEAQQLHA